MSVQITTAFVNQYRSNVEHLLQQKGSRLRPFVRMEMQSAEFDYYDRIGSTEANEVLTRHADTPLNETPHDRRRVSLRDFDWADLVDRPDRIRALIDPTSPYAQAAAFALGRKMDDIIIEGALGTAYTGKTGATSVTFPSTQVVAVDDHTYDTSTGDNGLSLSKLILTREMLIAAEVDPDEEMYMAVTAKQLSRLLETTEITSADYNTVKALVKGDVDTFMGFKFIRTQRLLTDANSDERIIAWAKSGILLAVGMDINVDIGPRRDKRNATQVYASASFGATRMEEEKVVEVLCDPT